MSNTAQIINHGITSTCPKCKHVESIDLFMATPKHGDLPTGVFQCPAKSCRSAFKIQPNKTPKIAFIDSFE